MFLLHNLAHARVDAFSAIAAQGLTALHCMEEVADVDERRYDEAEDCDNPDQRGECHCSKDYYLELVLAVQDFEVFPKLLKES